MQLNNRFNDVYMLIFSLGKVTDVYMVK